MWLVWDRTQGTPLGGFHYPHPLYPTLPTYHLLQAEVPLAATPAKPLSLLPSLKQWACVWGG